MTLSGSYEQLFTYVMFAAVLFNVLGRAARFSGSAGHTRTLPRPYRTWGYPVVPLVFVLGSLGLVVNTLLRAPRRVGRGAAVDCRGPARVRVLAAARAR